MNKKIILALGIMVLLLSIFSAARPTDDDLKDYVSEALSKDNNSGIGNLTKAEIKGNLVINEIKEINEKLSMVDMSIGKKAIRMLTVAVLTPANNRLSDTLASLFVDGNADVTGFFSYFAMKALPHFFISPENNPLPICMRASNNRYVGCMPVFVSGKYKVECSENPVCDRKAVEIIAQENFNAPDKKARIGSLKEKISSLSDYNQMLGELNNMTGMNVDNYLIGSLAESNGTDSNATQEIISDSVGGISWMEKVNGSIVIKLG